MTSQLKVVAAHFNVYQLLSKQRSMNIFSISFTSIIYVYIKS